MRYKKINLVIYDTPTPNHAAAPQIYPTGFLERYRLLMKDMCSQLQIPYYDLIDLFPWDGRFMGNFIHPTIPSRQFIHRHLIYNIFKENT